MTINSVGILGSGIVGKTLGSGFLKHGYNVTIGTSSPEKLADWQAQNPAGKIGSFADAAKAELLVLAVKGTAASKVLQMADPAQLKGKTVIDTTNPIADAPPDNGVIRFFTDLDESLMEQLQKDHPEAHFVKAFNSIGNALMVDPSFPDGPATMFIAGDDPDAKAQTTDILQQFGWEVEDMGGAEGARAIEPLCILWCIPGFLRNQWNHAFKLVKT